jgi:hypothetical protein
MTTKVKLLIDISGRFDEGAGVHRNGVKRGDVVEFASEQRALSMAAQGYCQLDWKAEPGRAYRFDPALWAEAIHGRRSMV